MQSTYQNDTAEPDQGTTDSLEEGVTIKWAPLGIGLGVITLVVMVLIIFLWIKFCSKRKRKGSHQQVSPYIGGDAGKGVVLAEFHREIFNTVRQKRIVRLQNEKIMNIMHSRSPTELVITEKALKVEEYNADDEEVNFKNTNRDTASIVPSQSHLHKEPPGTPNSKNEAIEDGRPQIKIVNNVDIQEGPRTVPFGEVYARSTIFSSSFIIPMDNNAEGTDLRQNRLNQSNKSNNHRQNPKIYSSLAVPNIAGGSIINKIYADQSQGSGKNPKKQQLNSFTIMEGEQRPEL
ncbi:hypothetical protein FGO68_gene6199 [Halteria grandinella]|uniref:Uncharacterized protein n=1 Tax=Halteria grandinella TaxID=5974 RepID=A0A8J8NL94_HALGN|nr:hypothetical protein FGO68_gene6199 [Halteria grandinella]